ncbi:asparagine synthase (glutamine-hydrolyzing) [Lacticaseibacillus brantae]|uniref:asparagine synthase (glutamine-hydrolyzing) n=1 Tax=Lacticaseibacillus brantae DSM 23927 TaxID=1423727 RepID=A0A0R2AYL0_9LACO|nr:asparagine synthase (glutamine-hydrolyzing) [Lacticaseibacillus brantae]KRM72031.1 asparagine synthase [Lacticaseibacillus brantae DSM 23927]
MCGIIAFADKTMLNKKPVLNNMMEMIKHRGPNSSGEYINDTVALGFRRLSIIDLKGGSQPILNEDGSVAIIFNGEIYNYQSIREDLLAAGHIFTTHSDTEVLLHGYEEYGMEGLLKKIRGMFAFLIWDDNKQLLTGARDFFGIKPMYYYQDGDTFLVGSEIKAFLQHPKFKKELNKEALKPYLTFQYSALDETFFKNVYRVPEGHYFTLKDGDLEIKKYWDMDFKANQLSLSETIDAIDKSIADSVESHRISEVEVGSLLSSGVDSSYVTALLRPEHTFSIGFDNNKYHEGDAAKALADRLGLENKSDIVTEKEALNNFPLIQYHLDEPDSNPSCIPLYFLTKLAHQDVTVILSGEGADELFAGYANYGDHTHSKAVRVFADGLRQLPKGIKYRIAHGLKKMPNFHGRLHLYESTAPAEEFFIGEAYVFNEEQSADILKPDYQKSATVQEIVTESYKKVRSYDDEVKKMQYLDIHQFMPKDILLKADKLSMANSMELRVPFLDKEVAKVAEGVPTKYLINSHSSKYALREAANRHLPEEWANRTKLGFPVPIKQWLEDEPFYQEVRSLFEQDWVSEFFDQDAILDILDKTFRQESDDRRKVWTIYTFLVWYKVFFRDEEIPTFVEDTDKVTA